MQLAVGAAAGLAGLLIGKAVTKKPDAAALPKPLPMATRNDAIEAADRADTLRKRRGGAADIVSGAMGAEPVVASGKETLGS